MTTSAALHPHGRRISTTTTDATLYRRAKVQAASRGRMLKDLVEEGLELVLETPRGARDPISPS
jgi:hypothetical protein